MFELVLTTIGWFTGYFGLFGLPADDIHHHGLNVVGLLFALMSLAASFFVNPNTGGDDESTEEHVPASGAVLAPDAEEYGADQPLLGGEKSQGNANVLESINSKSDVRNFGWLEWNKDRFEGKMLAYPEREAIPEKINEQLIVELYSK